MKDYSIEDQMALNIDKSRCDRKVKQYEDTIKQAREHAKKDTKLRRLRKKIKDKIASRTEELYNMYKTQLLTNNEKQFIIISSAACGGMEAPFYLQGSKLVAVIKELF